MEATNRILEIMEKSGLTPSEFADKIEVQRSAISHITSGRNKPSLEFLIKIKNAFPEIDTDWLIFGIEKEEILEEISTEKENTETSESSLPTLFDLFEEEKISNNSVEMNHRNNPISSPNANSSKKLVKALLFYSDGTFEDFIASDS